jgi:hypothetical protein
MYGPFAGCAVYSRGNIYDTAATDTDREEDQRMSTGTAPSLLLDLASSTIADRQRTARDRDQRVLARRSRTRRGRRA